ncbi:uncharacterized protein LOC135398396 [Ornithodoros turicata]|uniref:uncharacterized protein LOC135398396 n=1 Tax=Ornithodoros turicata TaxID=34597 RepID=UPI003139A375
MLNMTKKLPAPCSSTSAVSRQQPPPAPHPNGEVVHTPSRDNEVSRLLLSCVESHTDSNIEEKGSTPEACSSQSQDSMDGPFLPSETFSQLRSQELQSLEMTPPAARPAPKKRKASEESLASILTQATENMQLGGRCTRSHLDMDDEETLFLLSLRNRLRSLEVKQKRLAYMQMQNVFFNLEFDE